MRSEITAQDVEPESKKAAGSSVQAVALKSMISKMIVYGVALGISAVISYFWVNAIDEQKEHERANPDYDPKTGWLDWII